MEQLRVHVRNLSMLSVNGAGDSKGRVELYERGYGKDAAGIAKEAITYGNITLHRLLKEKRLTGIIAKDHDFDVVLIDTAGRMQDNEVRMHSSIHREEDPAGSQINTAPYASPRQARLCE